MLKQILPIAISAMMAIAPAYGREITGTVVGENNTPIDFVNVVLYQDSTYVAGNITDADGRFAISTDRGGTLTAKISFLGYDPYSATVPASGQMGVITLNPSTVMLNEVVVKATRPSTQVKGNALVTDISGTSLEVAGTASDVLAQVPMVVNNSGTLEVFGKGQPLIYINGRPVNDMQELEQLNSQDIKNVEVITNPGAAYAADVKSVIRIRTKPPKGDGWSGTIRTDNGWSKYFRTGNSLDFKYRTGGLELFVNYGWWYGASYSDRTNDMITTTPNAVNAMSAHTEGKDKYNDMTGKIGFSWMINDRHSIGAYYQNGWNRHSLTGTMPSEIWQNGSLLERTATNVYNENIALPRHYANLYYSGLVGKLGIEFNTDFLWYKSRENAFNDEANEISADRDVTTSTTNHSRMFAEKLVLSYPLWKGQISVGEEYTDSRFSNLFTANIAEIGGADTRTDENNIATFVEISQKFGQWQIGAGLRYEHVNYNYYEKGQLSEDRSHTYNNLFPSLNVSTKIGNVNMGLNYTSKTIRPGYGQLDGTISYINNITYETGNPYLQPTKLQTVEYMAQWRQFFAQLSYTYYKDGVYHVTTPYGPNGEATLLKTANLDHRHYFQAFVGGQFNVGGVWMPKANIGMMKQWLSLPVDGQLMKMNTPIFMFQWQNAIKLPYDIWLNVDGRLTTHGWDNNTYLTNTPVTVNAKLYKGFFNDAFSVTLEANDIFNSSTYDFRFYNDAVQLVQKNFSYGRSVSLTLQYRFNVTRDRYRGTGAGSAERARF